MSREFDKTFLNFVHDWHSMCYGKIGRIKEKVVVSRYAIGTYVKFWRDNST